MTQSPPKAAPSSRPPPPATGVDGGRLITAGAAGISVLLLTGTAVVLWPRTYGSEANFVLDGGAHIENPIALAGRIEASLLEREVLASAAMDLPPELRSPDPIGKLRAGIRVQSRGALGFAVEFRGSDPQSVQRIANRLVDRAVSLVPKLATSPDDAAPMIDLAAKTHAVTEFLTAHPEMTLEQNDGKPQASGEDGALDLLRTEKRVTEQRLANLATDNPYAEPGDDPEKIARRLAELKMTIARREAALKQPKPEKPPAVAPELQAQWRTLLSQMSAAQAKVAHPSTKPLVTAHITSRAELPKSPLTPNRLVLSIVAVLLSMAAAMIAFVLPRKASTPHRQRSNPPPAKRSNPPPAQPAAATSPTASGSEPPRAPSSVLPPPGTAIVRSEPPPPARPGSEPPGPMAPMRPVVLSAGAATAAAVRTRRATTPGGIEAPATEAALEATALLPPPGPTQTTHVPPAAPLFGSRPPPGAGSYSVSSSHPPPFDGTSSITRTSVERLQPLQSQRPPSGPSPQVTGKEPAAAAEPTVDTGAPQIMSRPPALDPEAERWAARFEAPPAIEPAPPTRPIGTAPFTPPAEEEPAPRRGGAGRWKTQAMGSMVPLEVSDAREAPRPLSEPPSRPGHEAQLVAVRQAPTPAASTLVHHDVPAGWTPNIDPADPQVIALRDAIMSQGLSRHLRVAVTGSSGAGKARVACSLAMALAQAGARVLLVEADFDHPQVHQVMALAAPSGTGFSQQIIARRNDAQARPWAVMRCTQTLQALCEGRLRSPGMLASEEFERAIQQLGDQHHVLIMNAPSLDRTTDLRPVDALSQAAIFVMSKEQPGIHFGHNPLREHLQ